MEYVIYVCSWLASGSVGFEPTNPPPLKPSWLGKYIYIYIYLWVEITVLTPVVQWCSCSPLLPYIVALFFVAYESEVLALCSAVFLRPSRLLCPCSLYFLVSWSSRVPYSVVCARSPVVYPSFSALLLSCRYRCLPLRFLIVDSRLPPPRCALSFPLCSLAPLLCCLLRVSLPSL
jgi:hypothetical protein